MFSMNLIYKYVYFYPNIYLGCIFFVFILSNTCYDFSVLNDTSFIIFGEKPNFFQDSFVTNNFFCFIIINVTVVQIVFFERKCKRKTTVTIIITNNCNIMVDPIKIISQLNQCWIWKYIKKGIISISFLQYFIW